ncbi:MAG TPA: hypothetical protein DDW52_19735 [Planctomycetaceae bacterium]|nr:hypothetical protein [Planctomycetaceae bacterium]
MPWKTRVNALDFSDNTNTGDGFAVRYFTPPFRYQLGCVASFASSILRLIGKRSLPASPSSLDVAERLSQRGQDSLRFLQICVLNANGRLLVVAALPDESRSRVMGPTSIERFREAEKNAM